MGYSPMTTSLVIFDEGLRKLIVIKIHKIIHMANSLVVFDDVSCHRYILTRDF
jgi:hypothetical protein